MTDQIAARFIPMPKRIFLVHPTPLAMPPVDEAFKTLWREAQVLNLLDESLYADVGANGELTGGGSPQGRQGAGAAH
jgi:hypothetical protein